jgi:predicted transcriptional regulator
MDKQTILERWQITAEELTELIDANPSMRGNIFGYVAEMKLRKMWFSGEQVTQAVKYDDHDRKRKGDLVVSYRGHSFILESKSLQTSSIRRTGDKFTGKAQCDASDRRIIKLPDGSSLNTTCLLVGEFDLLAINVFAFHNEWRFLFAKNKDLPRSAYRKYTQAQREHLLASLVPVVYPPEPPLYDEPFRLLDEIIEERERAGWQKPVVVDPQDGQIIVSE